MDSERKRGLILVVVSFLLAGGVSAMLLRVDPPRDDGQAAAVALQPTDAPVVAITTIAPTLPPESSLFTPTLADGALTHEIQSGDTLFGIAAQYGLTVEAIMAVNSINDPAQIFAGQVLVIPGGGTIVETVQNNAQVIAEPSPTALPPTPIPPSATMTPTSLPSPTLVPPTATFTALPPTPIPPTMTYTHTATSIPPTPVPASPTLASTEPLTVPGETPIPPTVTLTLIPPSATFTPTPLPTATPEGMYEVLPDDTLYRIARLHNVDVDVLIAVNNISDPSQIFAGQMLNIPDATAVAPLPTATIDMRVLMPTPAPVPQAVNGLPLDTLIVMPESVRRNVQNIFRLGQVLGRNPRAFSKIGDSTIENPHFLSRFDSGPYNLGVYGYLQGVIDQYPGSFSRQGMAVRRGMHSWSVFDPMWAGAGCGVGETPIDCEFRLHNPSVVIIRLGSNDVGVPRSFERNLRRMVERALELGIVPIIGTKADRHEGSNINNEIMRQVAAEYAVPLWDYDLMAATVPGRGLTGDGVHLTTFFAHDWSSPVAFTRGHGAHSITALMVLDAVWRTAMGE